MIHLNLCSCLSVSKVYTIHYCVHTSLKPRMWKGEHGEPVKKTRESLGRMSLGEEVSDLIN